MIREGEREVSLCTIVFTASTLMAISGETIGDEAGTNELVRKAVVVKVKEICRMETRE